MIINTSENAMSRFIPEKRGCYTDKEFQLKTLTWEDGYRYSMNNCLYSSLLEKIFNNCSCVPAFIAPLITLTVDKPPCRYFKFNSNRDITGFVNFFTITIQRL
jgi:hypothetical protein